MRTFVRNCFRMPSAPTPVAVVLTGHAGGGAVRTFALSVSAVAQPTSEVRASVPDEPVRPKCAPRWRNMDGSSNTPRLGEVWVPSVTTQGWHPYPPCHWVKTQQYGWYYDDKTPWGQIVHHYGRWFYHDLDHVPGRPWIESDVDVDDRTDDVGRQHDDNDAVDVLERGDPFGLAQQHRHAFDRSHLARLATIVELRGLDEDPLIAVVELHRTTCSGTTGPAASAPSPPIPATCATPPSRG